MLCETLGLDLCSYACVLDIYFRASRNSLVFSRPWWHGDTKEIQQSIIYTF
jgi:hypothetical protein